MEEHSFPITEKFLKNKQLNDILYAICETCSKIKPNSKGEAQKYCYKTDLTPTNIRSHFSPDAEFVKDATIKTYINALIKMGYISEDTFQRRKIYIIKALEPREFTMIDLSTLQFFIDAANSNVIKIYAYLKFNYETCKFNHKPFYTSKRELLNIIGYENNSHNLVTRQKINNIMEVLQSVGLIEYHYETKQNDDNNFSSKMQIDNINLITNEERKRRNKPRLEVPVTPPPAPKTDIREFKF